MFFHFVKFFFVAFLFLISTSASAANLDNLLKGDWLRVSTKHFDIVTDMDEEKARRVIDDLEAYRYFTTNLLGLKMVEVKPLRMIAVKSASRFRQIGLPDRWAGVFVANLNGTFALANLENYNFSSKEGSFAQQVLLHEYNHFLFRFTEETHAYPMWFDEGMSDYLGTFNFDGEKVVIGKEANEQYGRTWHFTSGNSIIDTEWLMTTQRLELTKVGDVTDFNAEKFYGSAFIFVHYLHSSPALRKSLANYIKLTNLGYKHPEALAKSFGMSHAELDSATNKYLRRNYSIRTFSANDGKLKIPKADASFSKLDKAMLLAHVSETLAQIKLLDTESDLAFKKELVKRNLELNPKSADAEFLDALYGNGTATNSDSLALAKKYPTHAKLQTMAGLALFSSAENRFYTDLEGWDQDIRQARDFFRHALKLDPQLGLAYFGLGQVYRFLPNNEPMQEGAVGFDSAALFDRDPQTFKKLADLYLRMDKPLDALPALRNAIAFDSTGSQSSHALIADNLEILANLTQTKAVPNADGLEFESGAKYQGKVRDNKPDGIGQMTRPNGSYYGNFVNGIMHGKGKIVTHGGYTYEGDFTNGIARGKGMIMYPKDSFFQTYEGDVKYGLPSGIGTRVSKNGRYVGEFSLSEAHGKGDYVSAVGNKNLQGQWRYGRYIWPEENGVIFGGRISASGKRDGDGFCRSTTSPVILSACFYKDGVRQKDQKPG
jgi:hypothetical protein